MADLQTPNAATPLTERNSIPARSWFSFFATVAKRLSNAGSVTQITTADAATAGETQALANELKAKVNELLQSLKQ